MPSKTFLRLATALIIIVSSSTAARAIPLASGITLETTCTFSTDAYWDDGSFSCTGVSRGQFAGASDRNDLTIQSPFVATCLVLCSVSISGYHWDYCEANGVPPYETVTDGVATIRGLTATWLDGSHADEPAELTLPFTAWWFGTVPYAVGGYQSSSHQYAELRFLDSGRTAHDWTGEFGEGLLIPLETANVCLDEYYYEYTTQYSMTLAFAGA